MKKSLILFWAVLFSFCLNLSAQWKQNYNILEHWSVGLAIDACDSATVIISVRSNDQPRSILLSTDAGQNWSKLSPPFSGSEEAEDISITDKNHIWAALSDGRIVATTDGGASWNVQFYDTSITGFMNYVEMFDLNNGIAMGDPPGFTGPALFLKTTDGGAHWNQMANTPSGTSGDLWRRLNFIDINTGYFYNSGGQQSVYRTENSGIVWTKLDAPLGIHVLKFYNVSSGLAYGALDAGNTNVVAKTSDKGNTWQYTNIPENGWGNDIEFVKGRTSFVWMTNGTNLYYSKDWGSTWTNAAVQYSNTLRDIVFTDANNGWLLGDNGVLMNTTNNGGIITAVENKNEIPSGFSLSQNYPNPFNPSTTIKFAIPYAASNVVETPHGASLRAMIKIYDALGREVAILVNENKSPGNYEVKFDASDLPSGIYIYRMTTGTFSRSRKMILLK